MALLEVCAADIESVQAAVEGGAHRIELCSALSADGLTPSMGLMAEARRITADGGVLMNVLMRPDERPGFILSDAAAQVVCRDIAEAARIGADGVVIGALTPEGDIDIRRVRQLTEFARDCGLSVTFHRAFDHVRKPLDALEELIEIGCDRLLTSGQASTAQEGRMLLRQLVELAAGRIVIMPGAGVTPDNAADIARYTGAAELHSSCRRKSAVSSDAVTVRAIASSITRIYPIP
ncbi:MAG: copper homeostasis protein CutC [Muribaculaceae bacterium]|nr:copper homeostasis protein CutC [Muribaculaceae bacterium]